MGENVNVSYLIIQILITINAMVMNGGNVNVSYHCSIAIFASSYEYSVHVFTYLSLSYFVVFAFHFFCWFDWPLSLDCGDPLCVALQYIAALCNACCPVAVRQPCDNIYCRTQ